MKARPEMLFILVLAVCACIGELRTDAAAQTDATLTQATYFTFRMEQLKEVLGTTPAQQRQMKSMVEQETSELMQYACNPSTSRKDKLKQFREVFTNTESGMRSILTGEQWGKLHQLNEQMLQEFKVRNATDSCTLVYWGRKTQP